MEFADYKQFADPIVLPINGRKYEIPPVSGADGVKFTLARTPGSGVTMSDEEFFAAFLGDTYGQMLDDGVPAEAISRASAVAVADYQRGRETAQMMWETGAVPKAMEAWIAAHSTPTKTNTDAAKKTPSRASTSGTKPSQTKRKASTPRGQR